MTLTIYEALILVLGVLAIGVGYTWLFFDLQHQIKTYQEYCPSLEEDDNKEGSED